MARIWCFALNTRRADIGLIKLFTRLYNYYYVDRVETANLLNVVNPTIYINLFFSNIPD